MEELGVSARLERLGKLPASEKTGQEFIMVYRGKHDGPFSLPCEEISAVAFFPPEIVERWVQTKPEDFAPGFLECWRLVNATQPIPVEANSSSAILTNNPLS